ncbi:MAG: UvrD-helicase domain-containing protein [Bacteroidales bacterium]|nr:UvrD-helicase domain-containing protein [Bacteroidales bacterium]
MGKGTLTIYNASAGSGKTYKLAGIYLTNLFKSRYSYRRILAVTFTNKATAEMKSRILDHLHKLATGEDSEYLNELIESTGKTEAWIRNEAKEILNSVLHDFSRFSVTTIDSFFQKILRAFAREVGLHSGFNIELDHSTILSASVDTMIESAVADTQLKDWLITYAMYNIDEEKSWNLKGGIIRLAEELFKEKFKILSADERSNLENKEFLLKYIGKIKSISSSFENKLHDYGKRSDEIFSSFGLTDDMFYRKGQGVPRFIKMLSSGNMTGPNNYVREIESDPPHWSTGKIHPQLQDAINNGLEKILRETIHFYDEKIAEYNTARAILRNIYALGILTDVLHNVRLITNSENSFLLSDAGEILNLLIKEDQTPFIYEKVGNRYENFMIDEFQDTSSIQWDNFSPLIENSMAGGFDNLVVGDVKQSIYRWRNGDWQILGTTLANMIDDERYINKSLTINWRSRQNIIKFNNSLFSVIPRQIDEALACDKFPLSFGDIYSEAVQTDPGKSDGGYVRLEFIKDEPGRKWQETVLERLPGVIETFQDKGYKASDIGIIVRDGKEGAMVLKSLIDYDNNAPSEKKQTYNYNVVSNDSLLLSKSPVINFIISVISVLNDPSDMISRAAMLRFFLLSKGSDETDKVSLISEKLIERSENYFPEEYESFLDRIKLLPLYETTESIIGFFGLGEYSWNVAYLNTFQDYVMSFTGKKNLDIQSFLDWWKATGIKKSVVLPGNQDAMRILTIHKSKGLEYKVVILPFLSWNLDYPSSKQPVLWVKPESAPFNELGIVPVKYNKELADTIFADDYINEKFSVYIDNINLLYVAFTRAKDAIYSFSSDNPKSKGTVSMVLKNAVSDNQISQKMQVLNLSGFYNSEAGVFEFGEIPENRDEWRDNLSITSSNYSVNKELESLKLKLHGENYFSSGLGEVREKINYGKLMHEIFEGVYSASDVPLAIRKLVLEGKLPEEESSDIEKRIISLISSSQVSDWFMPGNVVMNEAGILLPSGITRRPDRVILRDGKTIVVDFKFGELNPHYTEQVDRYRSLLKEMGYENIEAFIWYVDKNKIISV